jgi:hypothetical protein
VHPNLIYLRAALRSLRAALSRLDDLDDEDGDRGTLRAWAPSDRRGGGGHAGLADVVARPARRDLRAEVAGTMAWLFPHGLTDAEIENPSARTISALPWIVELDTKVRTALRIGDGHEPMPGVECPACGQRTVSRWYGIMTCPCECGGRGCMCAMPGQEYGAVHAWPL